LQTLHLLPSQIGHLISALCGAGKVTVIARFNENPPNNNHLPQIPQPLQVLEKDVNGIN
jgi:hypothetical protein